MRVKNPHAVSPRVPAQRYSAQGESVPKARPRGVVDGKPVNIPVPVHIAMGGRRRLGRPGVGCPGEGVKADLPGKSGRSMPRRWTQAPSGVQVTEIPLPGKAPKLQVWQTVPETDTGGRGEYPQAFETTRVKELGKLVP
jgi:hypothetical protein